MTEDDTRRLLEFCAAYDATVSPRASLASWHEALNCAWVPGLSLEEAESAVAEHYQRSPVRVAPADILRLVRDDRLADVTWRSKPPRCGTPPNAEYLEARAELEAKLAARKAQR